MSLIFAFLLFESNKKKDDRDSIRENLGSVRCELSLMVYLLSFDFGLRFVTHSNNTHEINNRNRILMLFDFVFRVDSMQE